MNLFTQLLITLLASQSCFAAVNVDNQIVFTLEKYNLLITTVPETGRFISTGNPLSETWSTTDHRTWTVGFYAGSLWMLYKFSGGDKKWKNLAEANQVGLVERQFDTNDHDVGFIIMSSYGLGLELTGNRAFEDVIIQAAISLSGRFFRLGNTLRSWNNGNAGEGEVKVIVDNMMNLNILFKASELTNNAHYRNIAIAHAEQTILEHVRPDGGTYHVVAYNETTGLVRRKYTAQGYATESTWSRGQAWAIYGFTETYKNTNDTKFLDVAEKLALYYMNRLPEDYVPYWDFDSPYQTGYEPRDTAAASISACALLELWAITGRSMYAGIADLILTNLSTKYKSDGNAAYRIPSILVNGTVHKTNNDFNTAIVYADYYFLKALDLYRQHMPMP